MTPNEIRPLGALLSIVRPDWQPQAIVQSLQAVADRPTLDVMVAAAKLAADKSMRTPALLPRDGVHWSTITKPAVRPLAERQAEIRAQQQAQRERRDAARASLERARRECTACNEEGRLPTGMRCGHSEAVRRRVVGVDEWGNLISEEVRP